MFAFAAISGALMIHWRISSGVNFAPTPSSTGPFLLPSPPTKWQTRHLESVNACFPRSARFCAEAVLAERAVPLRRERYASSGVISGGAGFNKRARAAGGGTGSSKRVEGLLRRARARPRGRLWQLPE